MVLVSTCFGPNPLRGDAEAAPLRAFSEEEIAALWDRRPSAQAPHRSYIFIDEADIVDGTELPLFRVEAQRHGAALEFARGNGGDPGLQARIADLAPELARETERQRRAAGAFFSSRPGVARDVPETPDIVGPLLQFLRSR